MRAKIKGAQQGKCARTERAQRGECAQDVALVELRWDLGSVKSNLERHAAETVSPGATTAKVFLNNARKPQRLSLSGVSRYHLGVCPAIT